MTGKPLTTADYPIVEQRPDLVEARVANRWRS